MKKSAIQETKRKRGRPAIGPGIAILLKVRPEWLNALDKHRARDNSTRQQAIRDLVTRAIDKRL